MQDDSILAKIDEQVRSNPVVLFMKGTPEFPMCGYSAAVVEILEACGVRRYLAVNVLEDEAIRAGVKRYANWPTIPQLYIGGQFVGGCDIARELYAQGELQRLLREAGVI